MMSIIVLEIKQEALRVELRWTKKIIGEQQEGHEWKLKRNHKLAEVNNMPALRGED